MRERYAPALGLVNRHLRGPKRFGMLHDSRRAEASTLRKVAANDRHNPKRIVFVMSPVTAHHPGG